MAVSYTYRRSIRIEKGKVAETLTDFPLAIHINAASGRSPSYDLSGNTSGLTPAFFSELGPYRLYQDFEGFPTTKDSVLDGTGNFTLTGTPTSCRVTQGSPYQGYNSLEWSGTAGSVGILNTFLSAAQATTTGSFCTTWKMPALSVAYCWNLLEASTSKFSLQTYTGKFRYWSSGTWASPTYTYVSPAVTFVTGNWYKVRIEWRLSGATRQYRIWITDVTADPAATEIERCAWTTFPAAWSVGINMVSTYSTGVETCYYDNYIIQKVPCVNTSGLLVDYGYKFAVTASDGTTEYNIERVTWDASGQTATIYVTIPTISKDVDTVLYLWYDHTAADNTSRVGTTTEIAAHTAWPSTHKAVLHLEENPAGTAPQFRDPTVNDNLGTAYGSMIISDSVDGHLENGINFDGSQRVAIPHSSALDITGDLTVLCSAYINNVSGTGTIIGKWLEPGNNRCWALKQSAQKIAVWLGDPANGTLEVQATTTSDVLNVATWHRVGFIYTAGDAVTFTLANPCVVTYTAHGLLDGDEIIFLSTTDVLPLSIVSGTKYYIRKITDDTFHLYDTEAHALATTTTGRISTLGETQSGTHLTSGKIDILVDGTIQASAILAGTVIPSTIYSSALANVELGASDNGGQYFFYGSVDEPRIISGVHSPAWILAEYQSVIDELSLVYEEVNTLESTLAIRTLAAESGTYLHKYVVPTIHCESGTNSVSIIVPRLSSAAGGAGFTLEKVVPAVMGSGGAILNKTIVPSANARSIIVYTEIPYGLNGILSTIIPILTSQGGYNIGTGDTVLPLPVPEVKEGRGAMRQDDGALPGIVLTAAISSGNVMSLAGKYAGQSARLSLLEVTDARSGSVLKENTLPVITCTATAIEGAALSSSEDCKLPVLELTATSIHGNNLTGSVKLPYLIATGTGSRVNSLSLSGKLILSLSGSLFNSPSMSCDADLPMLSLTASHYTNPVGTAAIELPALRAGLNRMYASARFTDYVLRHTR